MKIFTAVFEALLIFFLFALFTVPFWFMNSLSASQINLSTIAQAITNR